MLEMKIPILTYHRITDDGDISKYTHLVAVEQSKFSSQMQYLVDNGFETITISDLLAMRNGSGRLTDRCLVISFDDGFESVYRRGMPIMKKNKIRATLFIVSGFVDTSDYMSWDQILEMKAAGMDIESHTHTHPVLTRLSPKKVKEELTTSKEILEERLQSEITTLCVPGGFTNDMISAIARECGYSAMCTSYVGLNRLDQAHFELRRLGIKGFDSMSKFAGLAHGRTVTIFEYRLRQTGLSALKKVLGVENYERMKTFFLGG